MSKTKATLTLLAVSSLALPFVAHADDFMFPPGMPIAGHLELGAAGQSILGGGSTGAGIKGGGEYDFYVTGNDLADVSGSLGYLWPVTKESHGALIGNVRAENRFSFWDNGSDFGSDFSPTHSTQNILSFTTNLNGIDADLMRSKYLNPEVGIHFVHNDMHEDPKTYAAKTKSIQVELDLSPIGGYRDFINEQELPLSEVALKSSLSINNALQLNLNGEAGVIWNRANGNYEAGSLGIQYNILGQENDTQLYVKAEAQAERQDTLAAKSVAPLAQPTAVSIGGMASVGGRFSFLGY